MKLTKKSLLLALSLVMALSLTVMGTIAYLTDTQAVVNKFTSGKVDIIVDETIVDEDGNPVDEDGDGVTENDPDDRTEEGNDYHLVPGKEYTKDPTMTIKAGSEPSYVRFHVVITDYEDLKDAFEKHDEEYPYGFVPTEHVDGEDESKWELYGTPIEDTENDTLILEYRYTETVDASEATEDVVLPALFTSFTTPKHFDNDDMATLDALEIHVIGEAIQAEGFDTVDAAWAAFKDHDPIVTPTTTTGDDTTGDDAGAQG